MFNQPKGVFALSSTEMWERFSFYTMQSILVLYAAAHVSKDGLGWSNSEALYIAGFYGAAVYATPAFGGFIADRYLGSKKSVALGGILMCLGHFILVIHSNFAFFSALALLCIGCGFLKPCISSLVGECYKPEDKRRESGFAIFYMAINIGGFIGPFVAGSISDSIGYHTAFAVAGFGLLIGLFNFYYASQTSLKNIGNKKGSLILDLENKKSTKKLLTQNEKNRLYIYMAMCVGNIAWNVVYGLPYGLLTLYAQNNIERTIFNFTIPATWFYGMYGLFIILISPILALFYQFLEKKNINFTLSNKLASGYFLVAIGCAILLPTVSLIAKDSQVHVPPTGLIVFYIIFSLSELLTVPVLLSAATKLSPVRYSARMVSFNMVVSWSLGAWISGIVSGWTLNLGAVSMFVSLIFICLFFGILHLLFNKKIELICNKKEENDNTLVC